jgi:hypothetical protein
MTNKEPVTAQDYQDAWDEWHEKHDIVDFVDNDEAGWKKVQDMDPALVWTNHSTCENEQVTPGAEQYRGCCWDTFGWYIGTVPWTEDSRGVDASATISCQDCNPDGLEVGDDDCAACEGNGIIQHYFD